jgi:hypothetical protein
MATIDIALPDELMAALTPPVCANMQLPSVGPPPSLTLPMAGLSLQGIADFSIGLPTLPSMDFSLIAQLAPMMASMECLLKILGFFGKLVGSTPLNLIPNFISGLEDLADCVAIVNPAPMACFVKQVLGLIAGLLLAAVDALESVLALLSGLQIQISAAEAAGNDDLMAALTCAQENAGIAAQATMQSLQPISVLLTLAGPFISLSGHSVSVTIPAGVPASDLAGMQSLLETLGTVAQTMQDIADAIPC